MASRIGKGEWVMLYIVTGALDFAQLFIIELILGPIWGIGVELNEGLDIAVGAGLTIYFPLRKVSLIHPISRLSVLIGVEALEEFSGGFAQTWIGAVYFIKRSVDKEQAGLDAAKATLMKLQGNTNTYTNRPANQDDRREPDRNPPQVSGGRREVMVK